MCPEGSTDKMATCCDVDGDCFNGGDDWCCDDSFYCSNDGEQYAIDQGGILCPGGEDGDGIPACVKDCAMKCMEPVANPEEPTDAESKVLCTCLSACDQSTCTDPSDIAEILAIKNQLCEVCADVGTATLGEMAPPSCAALKNMGACEKENSKELAELFCAETCGFCENKADDDDEAASSSARATPAMVAILGAALVLA